MSIRATPQCDAPGLVGILERHGRAVDYPKGQMIYAAGAHDSTMMLILKGRVEISRSSVDGRRSILTHLGPGDMLGELAALDGGARSADAVAATAVRGRILEGALVLQRLRDRHAVPASAPDLGDVYCACVGGWSGASGAAIAASVGKMGRDLAGGQVAVGRAVFAIGSG